MSSFYGFSYNNINKKTKRKGGHFIMKRKRLIALLLTAAMTGSLLAGCGSSGGDSGSGSGSGDSKATGKVYYLNFKPEQAD